MTDAVSNPDVLFVPTRPRDHSKKALVELRKLPDGRTALPAYTSLQVLTRSRGPQQPWIGLDTRGMNEVRRTVGYDVVLIDADLSPLGISTASPEADDHVRVADFMVDPVGRYRPRRDQNGNGSPIRRNRGI